MCHKCPKCLPRTLVVFYAQGQHYLQHICARSKHWNSTCGHADQARQEHLREEQRPDLVYVSTCGIFECVVHMLQVELVELALCIKYCKCPELEQAAGPNVTNIVIFPDCLHGPVGPPDTTASLTHWFMRKALQSFTAPCQLCTAVLPTGSSATCLRLSNSNGVHKKHHQAGTDDSNPSKSIIK